MLRPVVPEDFVEYCVYFGGSGAAAAVLRRCNNWLENAFPFLASYVWQKEAFKLEANVEDGMERLYGRTEFGDCLLDEWFIVFLLFELSRAHKDLVVQVWDNDGQFLLIEAAANLPEWLEPELSDHRVFVVGGELHIIPFPCDGKEGSPFAADETLTLVKALQIVREFGPSSLTLAAPAVRGHIARRLSNMPQEALLCNFHGCRLRIPAVLAAVLQKHPDLVAPAVEAFYYRSLEEQQVLRSMSKFGPHLRETVDVRVRFTRLLFAQLLQQTLAPPGLFSIPARTDANFKRADLGMKLTCGFEILFARGCPALEQALMDVVPPFKGQDDGPGDDDEGWMLVSPDEVHDMLAQRETEVGDMLRFETAAKDIQAFLGHESSMDGAEVPEGGGAEGKLFDVKKFLEVMQTTLGLEDMDLGEDPDDELGQVQDSELRERGLGQDFENVGGEVDLDLNLVKNILDGVLASNGEAGPMTNLLAELDKTRRTN